MKELKEQEIYKKYPDTEHKALVRILTNLLNVERNRCKTLTLILSLSIAVNIIIVGMFLLYESQWTYTDTTTTVTEQEVSGEESEINNVQGNQYKDNAVHNQEKGE